ncbi:hypothetical protein V5O48_008068, partial [Marasmius crinis-equi]
MSLYFLDSNVRFDDDDSAIRPFMPPAHPLPFANLGNGERPRETLSDPVGSQTISQHLSYTSPAPQYFTAARNVAFEGRSSPNFSNVTGNQYNHCTITTTTTTQTRRKIDIKGTEEEEALYAE